MTGSNLILLGIAFLLGFGIAKGIIPRLQTTRVQALAHRLATYVLFIGFWMIPLGIALEIDHRLQDFPVYQNIGWAFLVVLIVVALLLLLNWVLQSTTLRHRTPLGGHSVQPKSWYVVEVRSDFSKSPKDRIRCVGGSWEDVLRVSRNLSKPRSLAPQNHIICLDGTWNDAESETNVCHLFRFLRETCDNGGSQIARYYTGVGINENKGLSVEVLGEEITKGLLGCATGLGERTIRWLAYLDLVATYQPGDRLFIFGFSRGASCARILANHISEYGIPELVQAKIQRAPKHRGQPIGPDKLRFLNVKDDRKTDVPIEMMGLWDTVAAFGLPSNKFEPFRKLAIPDNVKKVYHLVAIDEKRWEFDATLIAHDARNDRIEEIWFAGAHTNVGGGSGHNGLSDIALRFMINRASEHGLCFKPDWESNLRDDVRGPEWPLSRLWPTRTARRIRVKGRESNALPRIHKSVFTRIGSAIGYCPQNFREVQKAYIREDRD